MTWHLFHPTVQFTSNDIGDHVGFVYLIENTLTGKKYIGQKKFWMPKYRSIKKKRKRFLVESNWKDYYGSNSELQADVEALGPSVFYREILHLCKGKGEMNYRELKEQMNRDVLLSPHYYNSFVGGKIHRKHVQNLP